MEDKNILNFSSSERRRDFQLRGADIFELVWEEILHPASQSGEVPSVAARHAGNNPHISRIVPRIDPSVPQPVFTITEKAPTRAFSWLKAPTSASHLRHY